MWLQSTSELSSQYRGRIASLPARIPGLDGLRVAAAFMVFVLHLNYFSVNVWRGVVGEFFWVYEVGHVAVDLFFVLSAYLLTMHWLGKPHYGDFMMKRFARIAPAYYASVIILFCIVYAAGASDGLAWVAELWKHLLFVAGVTSIPGFGVNPVFWSLSVEMFAYLALPLMVRLVLGVKNGLGIAALFMVPFIWKGLVVYVATAELIDSDAANYVWYAFPSFTFDFAVGILCASVTLNKTVLPAWVLQVTLPVGLLMLFVSFFPGSETMGFFTAPVVSVLCGWIVLAAINSQAFSRWSARPVVRYLSDISYSFYLWHAFFIYTVVALGGVHYFVAIPAALSLSLAAAAVSHRWIEGTAGAWLRKHA